MTTGAGDGIDWQNVRGVVFDVDGTLYDQRRLRAMMLIELLGHALKSRKGMQDIHILHHFRRVREELAESEAAGVLDRQFAMVAGKLAVSRERTADVVEEWIYRRPLKYMGLSRFYMVDEFFGALRDSRVKIGIFSDYPVDEKLGALKLYADAACYSLEIGVDRLKPQTRGLEVVIDRMSLDKSECVFIGDRDSRDGLCARRLGVPFILCRGRDFYKKMTLEFKNRDHER